VGRDRKLEACPQREVLRLTRIVPVFWDPCLSWWVVVRLHDHIVPRSKSRQTLTEKDHHFESSLPFPVGKAGNAFSPHFLLSPTFTCSLKQVLAKFPPCETLLCGRPLEMLFMLDLKFLWFVWKLGSWGTPLLPSLPPPGTAPVCHPLGVLTPGTRFRVSHWLPSSPILLSQSVCIILIILYYINYILSVPKDFIINIKELKEKY
jgi:hypothetical protein